jgi:carboxyl-terminal processing protease
LILDIRHNNGGATDHVETIASRFITSTLEKPEGYVLGQLVLPQPIKPQGPFQYVNPVVVLINGVCVSAGDYFPEVMKQISTVTVVGDTTAGASAAATMDAPAQYELPSGKKIYVGTTDLRRYDGLPWEWIGVAPDIRIEQTKEDLANGKDKQLEYAINMLKG